MDSLHCVVERITYYNPDNGYGVIKVTARGYKDKIAVVGIMPEVYAGSVLSVEGFWKADKKYGSQFSAVKITEEMPATEYGIEKYLGSGLIKGIGPGFAKRIVEKFGTETITVIENHPEKLLEVRGLGRGKIVQIKESWNRQKEINNIMLFLRGYDVSTAHATRIYMQYGDESVNVVKENPYRLADEVWGIGFKTADTIAQKLGLGLSSPLRLESGLKYALNALADDGHVYALRDQLVKKAAELLEAEGEEIGNVLDKMISEHSLILDEEKIYLPPFFYAETGIAHGICRIAKGNDAGFMKPEIDFDKLSRMTGVEYEETQQKAVQEAVNSKILILTGGPGTGKTTVTNGIIKVLDAIGMKILLAAPTGRAAKRMSEATGREAKTIHRLLEYNPKEGYKRNADYPLNGDVLILDECSMIDTILMNSLVKAIPTTMKLILVGDTDQLPSVGAGNVFRDIIDSGCFTVVRLTKIFRQAMKSRIITNAHRINEGKYPDISNSKGTDFFFVEQTDPEKAAEEIVNLVKNRLPGFAGVGTGDIQVLTPMQRGVIGAAGLNIALQEALNPKGEAVSRGGRVYRIRDKVMQIRNNYDKDIFNGDIGTVIAVNSEERELIVDFYGRTVTYEQGELDELVTAYAITIHKSQGSEYPVVVMPVMMSHFVMLQRNLIYTGITRAKKLLVLVGDRKAIGYAVKNVLASKRNTGLSESIRKVYNA